MRGLVSRPGLPWQHGSASVGRREYELRAKVRPSRLLPRYEDAEFCDVSSCTQGFRCADTVSPLQCYGRSGGQILSSLRVNYETVRTEDSFAFNAGCVMLITAVFKVAYVWKLYLLTRGATPSTPLAQTQ